MDRDQSGKGSHEEFMAFMEAEFQRLDKNKDGELDVKELTQTGLFTAVPAGNQLVVLLVTPALASVLIIIAIGSSELF
jgi:Ca2+-binding EF-hand superfamily protein